MRKIALSLAAAAAAVGLATPASATFYTAPAYGYGYGYQHNLGHARRLQYRIDHLQRELARLAHYRMISRSEYYNLRHQSRDIELQLRYAARYGHNGRESYVIQRRIERLEHRIARDVHDGRYWAFAW